MQMLSQTTTHTELVRVSDWQKKQADIEKINPHSLSPHFKGNVLRISHYQGGNAAFYYLTIYYMFLSASSAELTCHFQDI